MLLTITWCALCFHTSNVAAESVQSLEGAVQLCAEAGEFARQQVGTAMIEWWSQPAIDALPWERCKGYNIADVLPQ